jgi:hypothetical protein
MLEAFKIYLDRLKGGKSQEIQGSFSPEFLEVDEDELKFERPINVKGEAYLTEDHLVIHLKASSAAKMPCAIFNEMIETPLVVNNFYHTEVLTDIKDAIFDLSGPLREALLIELPRTIECKGGNCPSRKLIAPFIRSEKRVDGDATYFPFADLDTKDKS